MKLNLVEDDESTSTDVEKLSTSSFRCSCLCRALIVTKVSDLCAAFSALMIFVSRKFLNSGEAENIQPGGIKGPKNGMSLRLDTAILTGHK